MEMESSASRPLEIFVIPFLSPGHMIPLCEMVSLFAARGHRVTIITTPSNAAHIHKATPRGGDFSFHAIPFPAKEVGLPEGLENFFDAKDLDTASKLHTGMVLLRHEMEEFIAARRPDCVVSDMFHPWTADTAARLRIPRLVFHTACMFALCLKEAVRSPDSPHLRVKSDYEPFVFPGLPDPITMTRSQLPDYVRTPNGYTQMMEEWREAELKSYGVLVNNFYELDSAYTHQYKKIMGHKIFSIGPAAMIHRKNGDKVERGNKTVVGEHECLSFLDSKKPNSVLYICFGSACIFPNDQLMEIACGLEASGHHFIWVVFGKDNEELVHEKEDWLPKGFEERTRERGMIVKGWAPQVLILDHPSIGGFLTHCGWNSIIEGVSAGVPMVTWPLYAEQFYYEKLVTQVLGIGVDAGKEVVKRENVERAIRKLMDTGDLAAETRRQKAKELGEKARRAVEEGGSSHRNLSLLIEELKQLREEREKLLGAPEALSYTAPT
ncbi:probable UDP-glucosyl transferase 73B6 [Actinidia eriantha]|uniref:probable UDP-glucosyl transferase 73B6 n=1 Tax=Actinidia eriantha TaxID=165200 RepID=UPI002587E5EF|nr:probable UDP-glucosyl transferase 73B6 [Actinidia eriantha]